MSVTSGFAPPLNPLLPEIRREYDARYGNAMLQQEAGRQEIADHERAVGAQALAYVYGKPEAERPAAYQAAWRQLPEAIRTQAPEQYPGPDWLETRMRSAIPILEQYKLGLVTSPALTADLARIGIGLGGTGTGAAAPGPGASAAPADSGGQALALGMRQNNPGNLMFAGQPGASAAQGNRFASFADMPTGVAATAAQLALNQTSHGVNTVRGQVTRWVGDPKADLTSYISDTAKALGVGPDDPVDWTDPRTQEAFILAQQPHESAGGGAVLAPADVRRGVAMAAAQRGQMVQQVPAQLAGAMSPAAGRAGGVDVAGPGAAPDSALAPDVRGRVQDMAGQPSLSPGDALKPGMAAPAAPDATAAAPPPAQAPLAQAPAAQAPAAQAPAAQAPAAAGINAPPVQAANQKLQQAAYLETTYPGLPQAKAAAALLREQASMLMHLETWAPASDQGRPGMRNTLTNEFKPYPAERMHLMPDGRLVDSTGRVIATSPVTGAPPLASFKLAEETYRMDQKKADELSDQAITAAAAQTRLAQMRPLAAQLSTGAWAGTRESLAGFAEMAGMPGVARLLIANSSGPKDPVALAQEFTKLATGQAGDQDRATMGGRAGVAALKIFMANNPNLSLRPDANRRIMISQLIAWQASADYAQAALEWAKVHGQAFEAKPEGGYVPLRDFDAQWVSQRNATKYAAAMSALSGDDFDEWRKGLTPEEAKDVARVVYRADPTAQIKGRNGTIPAERFVGGKAR